MLTSRQRLAGLPPELARHTSAIAQDVEHGRLEQAERGITAAMVRAPQHPEVLRLAGILRIAQGRAGEAIALLVSAQARQATDPLIHYALARAYESAHDHEQAIASMRRACAEGPQIADCWYGLGRMLFYNGHQAAGIEILQRAVALAPQHISARTLLATILNLDGRPLEAQAQFREVLASHTGCGVAWWGLAILKPMPLTRADIEVMQHALQQPNLAANDRVPLCFAMAHALEHQREYSGAMQALEHAHAIALRSERWSADQFNERIDGVLDAFDELSTDAGTNQGEEVIFIVSLPRSGSTLIEQILASHSQVQGTSELPDLPLLIKSESVRMQQAFPQWVATHTTSDWRALGQQYLARTARWREHRPRFTDKMTGNWIHVGAIMAMLPKARVVIARRDPLETCFGCYRYYFNSHGYTHSFDNLAAAWRGFDRACERWKALYPDRVREQSYEDLQDNPQTQIRELLAFCDLPFEENCMNFHATQRRVITPSAAQVREPIRRDTARTDKYGALLDPLRSALGMQPFPE